MTTLFLGQNAMRRQSLDCIYHSRPAERESEEERNTEAGETRTSFSGWLAG